MRTQSHALYRRRRETEPLRAHITRRQSRVQAAVIAVVDKQYIAGERFSKIRKCLCSLCRQLELYATYTQLVKRSCNCRETMNELLVILCSTQPRFQAFQICYALRIACFVHLAVLCCHRLRGRGVKQNSGRNCIFLAST